MTRTDSGSVILVGNVLARRVDQTSWTVLRWRCRVEHRARRGKWVPVLCAQHGDVSPRGVPARHRSVGAPLRMYDVLMYLQGKGEDVAFTSYVDDLQNQIAALEWAKDVTVAFEDTE